MAACQTPISVVPHPRLGLRVNTTADYSDTALGCVWNWYSSQEIITTYQGFVPIPEEPSEAS